MATRLGRDPERSPLLSRGRAARSASARSAVGPSKEELAGCEVFATTLKIRALIMDHIDSPLSWQRLSEPEINFSIVRPLTEQLVALNNLAVVYCLLSNRLQFKEDAYALPHSRLNITRADLCEILAIRILTHYAKPTQVDLTFRRTTSIQPHQSLQTNGSGNGYTSAAVEGARQRRMSMAEPLPMRMAKKRTDELRLANVLIAPFRPFQGAPREVLEEEELEGRKGSGKACNALELAIVTEAKNFISCVSCQKIIDSVYYGRIYYTPAPFFDLLPDYGYKQKAITIYDPRRAPTLDHYRLRVPRYRMMLEFSNFLAVFGLMMIVMNTKELERINGWEILFIIYTCGWALDRFAATLEHGWRVFAANLWNGIDAAIIVLYMIYLPLRLYGVAFGDLTVSDYAISVLACESSLLFPRLAFWFLAGNVLVMSLRAMLWQFGILMFAAIFIFVGFWHALFTLDEGNYGVWEIAKYMVNIWFGLDSTGFDISTNFHPYLGPVIFFVFACLANTLFITVMVAILSTTFAELNADAKAEFMFRSAVGIFEGVKGDALFSFQPPINMLALLVLWPSRFFMSARTFHRIHVFLTRLTNAPVLLCITIFEQLRHYTRTGNYAERIQRALPKRVQEVSIFMSGAHADIEAVFDYAPDTKLLAAAAQADEWHDHDHDNDNDDDGHDDDAGYSGITDRSHSNSRGMRRDSASTRSNRNRRYQGDDSDIEEMDSDDESALIDSDGHGEFRGGGASTGPMPIIAKDHVGSYSQPQPAGILSQSPEVERTRTTATQITFDSTRNRRRSYPPVHDAHPHGGNGKTKESPSVLQRLYGPAGVGTGTQESHGTRAGGWDATPPSWVLELNATLRGIEERQRHLEQILGGAKDPDSTSVTSGTTGQGQGEA